MGLLADRIGRKGVIATSIMGPLLSLCWTVFICKRQTLISFPNDMNLTENKYQVLEDTATGT